MGLEVVVVVVKELRIDLDRSPEAEASDTQDREADGEFPV